MFFTTGYKCDCRVLVVGFEQVELVAKFENVIKIENKLHSHMSFENLSLIILQYYINYEDLRKYF